MLDYFGASQGGIYGSDVLEISQSLDHQEFIKWKYLLPNLKIFLSLTVTAAVLIFPVTGIATVSILGDQIRSSGSVFEAMSMVLANASIASGILGTGIGILGSLMKPVIQFVASRLFFNRGYYFALENGRLAVSTKVIKYKEIKNIISKSGLLTCEQTLTK